MNQIDILGSIASHVRYQIESNRLRDHTLLDNGFEPFPISCCDKASEILLRYLIDNGYPDYRIIYKTGVYRGYSYSHVWIEGNGYSIDITGDQYNHKLPGHIFESITIQRKEDFFFNQILGDYHDYSGNFMEPSRGYFNYQEFYEKYIK